MKKKLTYTILGVIVIFIITNPSISAFKEYTGQANYKGLVRRYNFFIFSIYADTYPDYPDQKPDYFYGVLGNFILQKKADIPGDTVTIIMRDTSWRPPITDEEVSLPNPYPIHVDTSIHRITVDNFASLIKKQYPVYVYINNKILVKKLLNKYPAYRAIVDTVNDPFTIYGGHSIK